MNWKILSLLITLTIFLFVNPFLSLEFCAAAGQTLLYKGRIWQKVGSGKMLNWNDANQYCQNLVLDGYSDWRLPSQKEMEELEVCTDVPKKKSSSPQKPENIVLGFRDKECNEDLDHDGGGRINPAFKLHMAKYRNTWQSRYWTQTSGFTNKGIRLKSETKHDGYIYFFFLYDVQMSKCSSPNELNFVRCVHDQKK